MLRDTLRRKRPKGVSFASCRMRSSCCPKFPAFMISANRRCPRPGDDGTNRCSSSSPKTVCNTYITAPAKRLRCKRSKHRTASSRSASEQVASAQSGSPIIGANRCLHRTNDGKHAPTGTHGSSPKWARPPRPPVRVTAPYGAMTTFSIP